MTDTDMQLIDSDPSDSFDFFPDPLSGSVSYSKNTRTGGLLVYVPDYAKISKPLSPHPATVIGVGLIAPAPGSGTGIGLGPRP